MIINGVSLDYVIHFNSDSHIRNAIYLIHKTTGGIWPIYKLLVSMGFRRKTDGMLAGDWYMHDNESIVYLTSIDSTISGKLSDIVIYTNDRNLELQLRLMI